MTQDTRVPDEAYAAAECFYAGNYARALELAEASIQRQPCPEAFGIIASVWEAHGAHRRAALAYRQGMQLFPNHPILTVNFARQLRNLPVVAREAAHMLSQLVTRDPDFAPGHLSLIETLRGYVADLDQALDHVQHYVARHPLDGEGHLAHALTLWNRGALKDALAATDKALQCGGKAERAWELKANIHVALGSATDALACYRALLRVEPHADTHSRLLMTMQYCDTVTEEEILAETRAWVRAHTAGIVPAAVWPNVQFDPEKPLKIGVLSRDFRLCSTLFLARPLFDNLPLAWTVAFYSNVECPDLWTDFFRNYCETWVDVANADDAAIAERIMADGIDVLVDLNGHTLGGRPGVFARKPVPVQVAWLDYVGTTGLATIDALIADAHHVPLSEQPRYVEPIHHVADDLYRYAPPWDAPAVADLPALRNGFVTFGCFNAAYKLTPTTLALWGAVLRAVPSARLLLSTPEFKYEDTCARFLNAFAAEGIDASRILFRSGAPDPIGMMNTYGEIDIALDPMPYSGGLTTIEGLYMGVPVVTLPGARFGSRHSSVHLRAVGMTDWIAPDRGAYVWIAQEKATNLAALAKVRAGLRARVAASPLMDGAGFARDFCAILRTLWRKACAHSGR